MNSNEQPTPRPLLFWLAIAAALAHAPLAWLMRTYSGPCGDGLCGFWEAIFLWLMSGFGGVVLALIGWVRGERPRWLVALVPVALVVPVAVLFITATLTQG
ncbi:hypothetical protein [Lysobacter sp. cf310]|uniref:hypothetical protein n=1 Tax=Lysobacter sp. cf310 TaxID=1761790 RepID=UPI0008E4EB79|nr:hypothetical protein [Lysobacter sp. cf310]SFK80916.1 hypothetical protein SAMN04487938_2120 [Lysobacter sp. cf310]